ncbi:MULTISPECIES: lysozyme inhibitor LprI family protein [Rhizobium]|uniref:Lysozyme inhibitor LprI family protein n=1 Tax=Rhizobium rhododendri TaxID=2506430 RepID=A0ABY8IQL3_9HYPH|nr:MULTISPECIES: lysozyme inhibitor LprI family protein [Rhizobium]TQX85197.1 DUF1311 domain-containing protein [Rhizobium sp. rho-13.1]TQY09485.1 DUF1311 domain-containing protein [Rhizobium sp. rho-1.1]WFS25967.1 lysozyme inhibitor LprI family protein [Rhizobium rhododendri]
MKYLLAAAAAASLPSAAHAIDCTRASSHIEHMICDDASLLRADVAMGRAYAEILKAAPDPQIHTMLIVSQKRWVAARDDAFGNLDGATNGMTGEGYPKPLQRSLVLHATEDRTKILKAKSDEGSKQPSLIQAALKQREFGAQFTGGPSAGFSSSCNFLPHNAGDLGYDYACFGTAQYQNNDRICGETQDWATFRAYTTRFVANVVAGQVKVTALCKDDICDATPDGGWDSRPEVGSDGPVGGALEKLDPEADDGLGDEWLKVCLSDKTFPPTQTLK